MIDTISRWNAWLNGYVWGPPMIVLLIGTGVALTGSAASSVAGFAVMSFAPMPLFSTYGIMTAMMILMAAGAALLVLPSLLLVASRPLVPRIWPPLGR